MSRLFEAWDRLPLWQQWPRYCFLLLSSICLLGLVLSAFFPGTTKVISRTNPARTQMMNFKTAIELYRVDHQDRPPATAPGLQALIHRPASEVEARFWKGPYLNDVTAVPLDPWGPAYLYQSPGPEGEPYLITSYGADGKPGGTGDEEDIESAIR